MPPWPAWDWSPSGHRGVTLALHYWGVAVRKKSYRPLPLPGKGLLRPGLLSGVVPTASVPATAAYPVLLSPEPGRRAARALCADLSLFLFLILSAVPYITGTSGEIPFSETGKPYCAGSGFARVGWRRSAVSVRFGRVLRWSTSVVIVSPVLYGLEVGEGSRMWFSE